MTAYIVPEAEAQALNVRLVGAGFPLIFAYQTDAGDWIYDTAAFTGVAPEPVDEALVAEGLVDPGELDPGQTPAQKYAEGLTPLASLHCVIYDFLPGEWDKLEPPTAIDYRTGLDRRLERQRIFDHGELQGVVYYEKATILPTGEVEYEEPVVHETYEYTRDSGGFALWRELTIEWQRHDGTKHPFQKKLIKTYSPEERIAEGKRRRSNVIDELELTVSMLLIATEVNDPTDPVEVQAALDLGRDLIRAYQTHIANYIEGSLQDIYTALDAEPAFPWLDNDVPGGGGAKIRDVMLAALNIWGL